MLQSRCPVEEDLDDVHVVHTNEKSKDQRGMISPTFFWHGDVSSKAWPKPC